MRMTSTPVSDATLFFSNISTKNQNVTDLGSAKTSFSEVMSKTTSVGTNTGSDTQKAVEITGSEKTVSKDSDKVETEFKAKSEEIMKL